MFAGLISCFYSWEWKQESCKAQRELGTPANWQNYSMNNSFPLSRWRFEDVGESDSKLWKDRRVNFIQGSIAGRLDNFPGSVETSSCLLNQKHQHLVRIKIAGGLHGWCTNQKKNAEHGLHEPISEHCSTGGWPAIEPNAQNGNDNCRVWMFWDVLQASQSSVTSNGLISFLPAGCLHVWWSNLNCSW